MVKEIASPSGNIKVYRNGQQIDFEVIKPQANKYMALNAKGMQVEVFPEENLEIWIDLKDYEVGEEINCLVDKGSFEIGFGSEHMYNLLKREDSIILGMGCFNTEKLNANLEENKKKFKYLNDTDYFLPYDTFEVYEEDDKNLGYSFIIMDDPKKYRDLDIRRYLIIKIAWEYKGMHYAENLVSTLTAME